MPINSFNVNKIMNILVLNSHKILEKNIYDKIFFSLSNCSVQYPLQ